jgi:phenylacetate-CoA ligase
VDDLRKVPISTKEDLRSAGLEKTIADWADISSLLPRKTSGSTGKPWQVYRTESEDKTVGLLHVAAMLTMGHRPWDRLTLLGLEWSISPRLHHRLGLYRREVIRVSMPLDEQIRRLSEFQPTIILGAPSLLRAIMHNLQHPLRDLMQPRVLITTGEVFDHALKKQVQSELDAEIFDTYGSMEFGRIASECQAHDGLHVNADHVVFECLDLEEPAGAGKAGLAVVTSLFAFGMPFIRYKLGDMCRLVDKTCSCGCTLPLMDHPIGREDDILILPSGAIKSPNRFNHILGEVEGIDQWRLVQEGEKQFVLFLVMRNKPDRETLQKIRIQFLEYLEEPVNLDIRLKDYMEEEVLKFRTFISKVARPEASRFRRMAPPVGTQDEM